MRTCARARPLAYLASWCTMHVSAVAVAGAPISAAPLMYNIIYKTLFKALV